MYCASCAEPTETDPCSVCGESPLLDGRYRLEHPLGRGASGVTWAATPLEGGDLVAIKAVTLPPGLAPKERELVHREVEILSQLHHPDVPELLDHLVVRRGGGIRIQYLVQAFVAGQTLEEELAERRLSEDEVLEVIERICPVLSWLHQRSPPVVHRDLKPANLIRRIGGGISLIDFGSVKDALSDPDLGGSTVAGTFGFMAPEQFRGDAEPRSDLYALGALAVALLTRVPPRELLDQRGRLQWHDRAAPSQGTIELIDALLAPDPADRPASAEEVRQIVAALRSGQDTSVADSPSLEPLDPPNFSRVPGLEVFADASPDLSLDPGNPWPAPPEAQLRPSTWLALGVGLGCLGLVLLLVTSQPEPAPKRDVPRSSCGGGPCLPPSDFTLRGLRLGQTVAEARATLPELVDAEETAPERVSAPVVGMDLELILSSVRDPVFVPGPHLSVRTLVADTPMRCLLQFAIDDRLSRLACDTDALPSASAHHQALDRIAGALSERHGARAPRGEPLPFHTERSWSWRDPQASIVLEGSYSEMMGIENQQLSLEVRSHAHERLLSVLGEQAHARAQAQRDASRRDAERASREELERLREQIGQGTDGL